MISVLKLSPEFPVTLDTCPGIQLMYQARKCIEGMRCPAHNTLTWSTPNSPQ